MAEDKVTHLPQMYIAKNNDIYGEETVNMKDFVIGALVGGIVGAAAGLLLAPKAGRDLREDVAIQAVSLKDKSVEFSSTAKEKTAQLSTQFVDKVKGKTAKAPTVFDDGTVSSEGEEPLDAVADVTSSEVASETTNEDVSEISQPSSI
ncbi:YtxH domain-containing protein [Solibacillus sp. CAU 1738]